MRCPLLGLFACVCCSACSTQPSGPQGNWSRSWRLETRCPLFPADNAWNQDISRLPVHPASARIVASIGTGKGLHPDFGQGANGIPYVVVDGGQPRVPIVFEETPEESDPGPYPVPLDAPVEYGEDQHILVIDDDTCVLYELYLAERRGTGFAAGSGAVFNLRSNQLRPAGWTSADAAGLPIFPGLVRQVEVQRGVINHALRFTVVRSRRAYVPPATHFASADFSDDLPPMGLRFRLKASVDLSGFSPTNRVILTALKKYGMFVADNGGDWFLTGAPSPLWNDEDLHELKLRIKGADFEVVDTGPFVFGN